MKEFHADIKEKAQWEVKSKMGGGTFISYYILLCIIWDFYFNYLCLRKVTTFIAPGTQTKQNLCSNILTLLPYLNTTYENEILY